ncbi:T6SS effector BTH_I2691 family protein [Xanthomonas translucens]|uniref:T6SS effector BTH_I2691 family protein n=1 Tax=Xanthomonas campestris pv. translucens TaxID=343 RepID=UPI000A8378AC|nr:T6SS effector BTH_I2691 family protein [Xanthomonas translucens]
MADGQQPTYSSNAQQAAATTPAGQASGCTACVKAGLPFLVLRPGLADAAYAEPKQQACVALLDKDVAGPKLSFGRYAMRTLRAGYLMVYYASPHTAELKANKGWQAFQVSDGGYLAPYPLDMIEHSGAKADSAFTCQRTAAYASAMLLVIPEPKHAGKVWVGYSDHPWSKPVREFYASHSSKRDARMTMIDVPSVTCSRSMPLTAGTVATIVADYDPSPPKNHLLDTPYPPLSQGREATGTAGVRPETVAHLMQEAEKLVKATKGQYTLDQLKIVSVPDAVGMTAETATARLTQCNSAKRWLYDKNTQSEQRPWRLQTALSIEGLLKEIDERNNAAKQNLQELMQRGVGGKKVTRAEFDRMVENKELPPGTFFQESGRIAADGEYLPDFSNGTIVLQNGRGLDQDTAKLKQQVLDKLTSKDGAYPFRDFLQCYTAMVEADLKKLAQVELDHQVWIQSAARKLVTDNDCSQQVRMDGLHFASLVADITNGGAMTDKGLEWYGDFLTDDPEQKEALLTRALLGNQDAFHKAFKATKLHKEAKNLFKLFDDTSKAAEGQLKADQRLLKAFPFYDKTVASLPTLKTMAAAAGHPLIAVAGGVALSMEKKKAWSAAAGATFERLMAGLLEAAGPGKKAVQMELRFGQAVQFWQMAGERLRQSSAEAASQATGSLQRQAGKVKSLVLAGSLATAIKTPDALAEQVVKVWKFGENVGQQTGKVATSTGNELKLWGESTAKALREGSAAFTAAGGVLQAYAIAKAFHTLTFGSDKERQVAYVGLLGAGMGLAAVTLELGEALYKHVDKAKGVDAALGRARVLKWTAGRISAAGLVIDMALSFAIGYSRSRTGDRDSQYLYFAQGAFFLGAAYASWMGAQATFAASGVAGAGAASASASAVSAGMLGLSWTGWGLVLIGLGLMAGYVAMRLQDTPTEEWAAKSIWGVADADVKWGSPQREQEELNKMLMGIRVEFEYSTEWIKSLGASAAAADTPGVVGEDARIWSKTVTTRLWMPQDLRGHLSYMLAVVLADLKGVSTTVYAYSNGQGTMLARLAGVDEARLQSEADVVVIEIGVDGSSYRSAQLEVTIGELAGERQVLVQQLVNG